MKIVKSDALVCTCDDFNMIATTEVISWLCGVEATETLTRPAQPLSALSAGRNMLTIRSMFGFLAHKPKSAKDKFTL